MSGGLRHTPPRSLLSAPLSAAPFLNYCQTRPHRAAFHGFTPGALWETKSVGPLAWTSTTPNQIEVKRGENELRI